MRIYIYRGTVDPIRLAIADLAIDLATGKITRSKVPVQTELMIDHGIVHNDPPGLRDQFMTAALSGLSVRSQHSIDDPQHIARMAALIADLAMSERAK